MEEIKLIMSDKIGELVKAMVKAQGKIKPIGKAGEVDFTHNGKRTQFGYALYTDMWNMAHEALGENGLNFSVHPMGSVVMGIMAHTSGEYIGGYLDIKQMPNKYNQYDAKDTGEWVTYLSKYLFKAALNLPTDDNEMLNVAKNMAEVEQKQKDVKKESEDDKMYRLLSVAKDIKVQGVDSTEDIDLKVTLVKAFLKENKAGSAEKVRDVGKPTILKLLRGEIDEL